MRKVFISVLTVIMLLFLVLPVFAECADNIPFDVNAKSAVLMDMSTGTIVYAKNADSALPPASVTKIMTLLLFMEEVDCGNISLDEEISVSEYAASMGGSQVFLEPGETMKAEDLLKSVVIASANDAAVTLAEKVAGSEEAFVNRMNERAAELGMVNTHFENVTGLDDDTVKHLTSSYDIALMSQALLSHEKITEYSTIWMDTIRNGEFGLTNTNRLVRFYNGATGLKTGSTSKAGFCMSATAKRDGMHLIAVIMGAPTRDARNEAAKQLLDYGFANYSLYTDENTDSGELTVCGGVKDSCATEYEPYKALLAKGKSKAVKKEFLLSDSVSAPIKKGDTVGTVRYSCGSEILSETEIKASEDIERIGFFGMLSRLFGIFFLK